MEKPFSDDIVKSLAVLNAGGILLYPTDTIWGIGCDATDQKAVERIYALKKRPDQKSMIILVADERDILKYVAAPDLRVFDYLATISKPTTVIYEQAVGLAPNLIHRDGSVGIRICRDEFCKHLIKRFRKPIVSTSANISGEGAPRFFEEISDAIKKGVDYVTQYRQDDTTPKESSAVIKWNNNGTVTVIRS